VLNKLDLPEAQAKTRFFTAAAPTLEVLSISAASHLGLKELKNRMLDLLEQSHESR
jgi:50S ribosomal subunit-associated GTPase HflX